MIFTTTIRTENNKKCPEYDFSNIVPSNIRYGTKVLNETVTGNAIVADAEIFYGIANSGTDQTQEFYMYNEGTQKIQGFKVGNIFEQGPVMLPLINGTYKMFWKFNKGTGTYLGPNMYCGQNSVQFLSSQATDGDKGEMEFTVTEENKLYIDYITTEEEKVEGDANTYYWWLNAVITKLQ